MRKHTSKAKLQTCHVQKGPFSCFLSARLHLDGKSLSERSCGSACSPSRGRNKCTQAGTLHICKHAYHVSCHLGNAIQINCLLNELKPLNSLLSIARIRVCIPHARRLSEHSTASNNTHLSNHQSWPVCPQSWAGDQSHDESSHTRGAESGSPSLHTNMRPAIQRYWKIHASAIPQD